MIAEQQTNLLNPAQAASFLDVSIACLAMWRWRGKEPTYVKTNGKVKYLKADLENFIACNRSVSRGISHD
jgi:predicted site-specific integrase-resolvase